MIDEMSYLNCPVYGSSPLIRHCGGYPAAAAALSRLSGPVAARQVEAAGSDCGRRPDVTNLRVFGRVARGEDRSDSDVDLLGLGRVQVRPGGHPRRQGRPGASERSQARRPALAPSAISWPYDVPGTAATCRHPGRDLCRSLPPATRRSGRWPGLRRYPYPAAGNRRSHEGTAQPIPDLRPAVEIAHRVHPATGPTRRRHPYCQQAVRLRP
jgi:hypothetical protein